MTITLEDVARLAGVSRTTASRVLNGRPGVRAETRARVLRVIRAARYRPNALARSLAARRRHPAPSPGTERSKESY